MAYLKHYPNKLPPQFNEHPPMKRVSTLSLKFDQNLTCLPTDSPQLIHYN